jgi:hypothetical protein
LLIVDCWQSGGALVWSGKTNLAGQSYAFTYRAFSEKCQLLKKLKQEKIP